MTALFSMANGDPNIYLSDGIWCRRSGATPVGWTRNDASPPSDFEDPFFRDDNWAWVKVHQTGIVDGGQSVELYLYAGIEDQVYTSDQIRQPLNQFTPEDLWSISQWGEHFDAGKVCRIPWFNGISTGVFCPISNPAQQPGDLSSKWYSFKWERHLVPPVTSCTTWNIALLAVIDDSAITGVTDFTVEGNAGFSQRNCPVV